MMIKKLDLPAGKAGKQSILYLIIVIVIAVLVCIGVVYYRSQIPKVEIEDEMSEELKRQRIIKKQLEELAKFRENTEPLTEQEIQKQLEELEEFRQNTQSLTEQEIQKQLEESEQLR